MKKLSLILCIIIAALSLFSCGSGDSGKLGVSLTDIKTRAETELDFGGAEFSVSTDDEYAEDLLMFQYGIEDETVLAQIDSYLVSNAGTNSAKTLAVIIFKDGAEEDVFTAVENTIKEIYITGLINRTAMYDPAQCEIAEKASFIRFDNALAVIAYDNAGNTAASDVLFK